jgi:hypothetical protein
VKVKVPFTFVLGDKTYPAGEYAFSAIRDNVIVQNSVGTRIAMRMANHVTGRSAGKTGQVVFDCYIDQCFLSQIWTLVRMMDASCSDLGWKLVPQRTRLDSTWPYWERALSNDPRPVRGGGRTTNRPLPLASCQSNLPLLEAREVGGPKSEV